MTNQEEEARIAAAVQERLEKIVAAQQAQFASAVENAMKEALKGVDTANKALEKERKAVEKQLDAAEKARAKAEKEGDKMADAYFAGRQKQFAEAARTELLRNLTRMHLEVGKTNRDIAVWLDVPMDFVENIRQLLQRITAFYGDRPQRTRLEGNPKISYGNAGRGGDIRFESRETSFTMWWEFAGGDAVAIVEIPSPDTWEQRTNLPLEKRDITLQFIAEQILLHQISGKGSFIIGETVITFYEH
jgi:hypothetical protein